MKYQLDLAFLRLKLLPYFYTMHKIYYLDADVSFDRKLIYSSDMKMESALCPLNAGLPSQHAMRQHWIRPIKLVGPAQRITDFEWSVFNDVFLEEDLVCRLQSAGFSGMTFRQAQLCTTTEMAIGRPIFELKVTGWGGMAHPSSGIHIKEKCSFCGRAVYGAQTNAANLFDIDKWDGSDFFLIWPMPRYIFITNEVAAFILDKGFSGVKVRELETFPRSVSGGYSPGHIEDWFDKDKATEILRTFTN